MNCYICNRAMAGDQSGACSRCKEEAVRSALQSTANAIRPANKPKPRYWLGSTITHCQVCEQPIKETFVDGATHSGQWAIMCKRDHKRIGRGLGMGRGQEYTRQADGRWLKTGG